MGRNKVIHVAVYSIKDDYTRMKGVCVVCVSIYRMTNGIFTLLQPNMEIEKATANHLLDEHLRLQVTHEGSITLVKYHPCEKMAWLFGSGKRAPSGQPETKVAREKQIANLKERVPGLEQKSTDSSLFEVRINAPPNGALVMLRVFLPTKFPSERPGELLDYLFFSNVQFSRARRWVVVFVCWHQQSVVSPTTCRLLLFNTPKSSRESLQLQLRYRA